MQRAFAALAFPLVLSAFQYPQSDRRRCNLPGPWRGRAGPGAFSILNRIGGDATGSEAMQPAWWKTPFLPTPSFSILNRIGGDATIHCWISGEFDRPPFSILNRIGGDATRGPPPSQPGGAGLSVSSIGSEAMQQRQPAGAGGLQRPFSILNRIGGDATTSAATSHRTRSSLSVSSIGSEAMQPLGVDLTERPTWPFSILNRIGGDATRQFSS